ncbi:polysialic acid transport protein KpsD precursor [mine drainage metagenome]|uniref:Polysialic acid transport protein KpsD n=1 Tax=mine drainage metagenome TaxID=410659 RepID=A0A1J5SNA9_9ZZZZ
MRDVNEKNLGAQVSMSNISARVTLRRFLLSLVFVAFLPLNALAQAGLGGSDLALGGMPTGAGGMLSPNGGNTSTSLADTCANSEDPPGCYKAALAASGQNQNNTQALPEQNTLNAKPSKFQKKLPELERSEFQDFVSKSLGKTLPMYGYKLFNEAPDTFAPVENIPVTPDYLIGPEDEIVIRAWGQIDINVHAVVNRNGEISLPKVGTIKVAGIRYQELQAYLKNAIGRVFRNFNLDVTLGKLRSVQVFVVGQARQPGVYTVSSLSTLVNTLFASGGPSTKGSLRHIQVKRNGQVITELDMYDLLLKGDKSKDVSLLPGDVIYIPPVGQQVAIAGSVSSPAIYELKDDKTTLAGLLEMAGGLTSVAEGDKVRVERIADHDMRKVEEFPLNQSGLERLLKDGDLVQVDSIQGRFDNAVTLRGNVASPGRFPWHTGMRVSDLIPSKDFLIVRNYWAEQNQIVRPRSNEEGFNADKEKTQGKTPTKPRDEINQEALYGEAVGRARTEVNWDYAVIERLNKDSLTTTLVPFNLGQALAGKDTPDNQVLEEGDVITIFSKNDIKVPIAKQSVFVRLEGEVGSAGIYKAMPGETLRQLVARTGGLTPNAYLYGAELDRESVRIMQQKRLEQLTQQMDEDIKRNLTAKQGSALTPDAANAAKMQAEAQAGIVGKMKSIQATGRIVLEIPPTSSGVNDVPDIALEDGDRFVVPSKPSTASVMGRVYNPNAFIFKPGSRVSDYLGKAGGPTRDADVDRIYLLRADGSVLSEQSSSSMFNSFSSNELMPGDTVIVPESLDRTTLTKTFVDVSQIFFQFAMGAAGLKILGL